MKLRLIEIAERIKAEYFICRHDIKMGRFCVAERHGEYRRAYQHVNGAIDYGLKSVIARRRAGIETVDLREELRSLKKIRSACLELASYEELSDVIKNHPCIKEIRERFGRKERDRQLNS